MPKKKDKYPNFPKKKDEYIPPNIRDEYDELSDLQDQLEEALDETLKEVEKRVKGQDEYIPPKKVEYPPKKRVKEKERPYLTPTRRPITGVYILPKMKKVKKGAICLNAYFPLHTYFISWQHIHP